MNEHLPVVRLFARSLVRSFVCSSLAYKYIYIGTLSSVFEECTLHSTQLLIIAWTMMAAAAAAALAVAQLAVHLSRWCSVLFWNEPKMQFKHILSDQHHMIYTVTWIHILCQPSAANNKSQSGFASQFGFLVTLSAQSKCQYTSCAIFFSLSKVFIKT